MNSKSYLLFPKILTGKSAEIHKASRRKVVKRRYLGYQIDGIRVYNTYLNIYSSVFKAFFKTTK